MDLKEDGSFKLNMNYFNYATGLTMTNKYFSKLLVVQLEIQKKTVIIFIWMLPHQYSQPLKKWFKINEKYC